jgi:hypothetical protein
MRKRLDDSQVSKLTALTFPDVLTGRLSIGQLSENDSFSIVHMCTSVLEELTSRTDALISFARLLKSSWTPISRKQFKSFSSLGCQRSLAERGTI